MILAAFTSIFVIIFPTITGIYCQSLHISDLKKGESLVARIKNNVEELSNFEDGSFKRISFSTLSKWIIKEGNNCLILEIFDEHSENKKIIKFEYKGMKINEEIKLEGSGEIIIEKKQKEIRIKKQ